MASILNSVMGSNNETEMKAMDANRYATKKTIAQGMLDIALLTANASQLKYILQIGKEHPFYTLMLTLICASITLQILSGILNLSCSLLRDCRLHIFEYRESAGVLNNVRTAFAFFTTVFNIFISAFDATNPPAIPIMAGVLLAIQGFLSYTIKKHQNIAEILNHVILLFIFLSSFIDVIKIGFGFEPAIPDKKEL